MNKRAAQRLNDVALNIIDLAFCLQTGSANEIGYETWKAKFARDKNYEAARSQWRGWKRQLKKYGLSEQVKDGRKDVVILKPNAIEVAEGLRAEAQAVLNAGKKPKRCYPDQVTIAGRTFHLKVYGRAIPPLTDSQYEALRESIKASGKIEVDVVVDRHDNVIDGKHRLMIAAELGLEDIPLEVEESDDPEYLERLAEDLNTCRRQLTRQQLAQAKQRRQARAEAKRAAGMSLRQIAEEEGVTAKTISLDLEKAVEGPAAKILGNDGRLRPARRPTPEETAERRRRIASLLANDEYGEWKVGKLAKALGVSTRTIRRDMKALAGKEPEEEGTQKEARGESELKIHVQRVALGEISWLGIDRETDPVGTCLEAAVRCLDQLRGRLEEPELRELADAAHGIVESVIWRLMEGAAA